MQSRCSRSYNASWATVTETVSLAFVYHQTEMVTQAAERVAERVKAATVSGAVSSQSLRRSGGSSLKGCYMENCATRFTAKS